MNHKWPVSAEIGFEIKENWKGILGQACRIDVGMFMVHDNSVLVFGGKTLNKSLMSD